MRENSDARKCAFCDRPAIELEAFEGPYSPLIGLLPGTKLMKSYRELYPYHTGSTLECRDCFVRPEPLWWIVDKEKHLGRRLSDDEIERVQRDWNLEAKMFDQYGYPKDRVAT